MLDPEMLEEQQRLYQAAAVQDTELRRLRAEVQRLRAELASRDLLLARRDTQVRELEAALAQRTQRASELLDLPGRAPRKISVASIFRKLGWPTPERLSAKQWEALSAHLDGEGIEVDLLGCEKPGIDTKVALRCR